MGEKEVIESVSTEQRVFYANPQFKSKALIGSEKLYNAMYKRSID
jgi:hypothetical protein